MVAAGEHHSGKCARGQVAKVCDTISSPTKMRMGATAAAGSASTMTETKRRLPEADEQPGGEGVPGGRPWPCRPGGRCRVSTAPHHGDTRDQGGHGLGEEDVARLVVVAGNPRALGHVDTPTMVRIRRARHRQVAECCAEAVDETSVGTAE